LLVLVLPIVSIEFPLLVGGGFRFSCPQAGRDDRDSVLSLPNSNDRCCARSPVGGNSPGR